MSRQGLILLLIVFFASSCSNDNDEKSVSTKNLELIPYPAKVLKRSGTIEFDDNFRVVANVSDSVSSELASYLVSRLEKKLNREILISDLFSTREFSQSIRIEIANIGISKEYYDAYELDITTKQILISASNYNGIFYGIQTLIQILDQYKEKGVFRIPKIIIRDKPDYRVRGLILNSEIFDDENILSSLPGLKINTLYYFDEIIESQSHEFSYSFIRYFPLNTIGNDIDIVSDISSLQNEGSLNNSKIGLVLDCRNIGPGEIAELLPEFSEFCW